MKSGLFASQWSLSMNDENLSLHCTIVALDDGHWALRYLVEMSNRFPGCRFRICELLEALLGCIGHDRSIVSSSKMTIEDTSLEHTANQTITFSGNFLFLLYVTPFISFDSVDCPYTIILVVVDPTYVEQFLVEKQKLHRVFF